MKISWLLLVVLSSCLLKTQEKVDLSNFDFSTTDPSELFFKNVRQSDYELTEMKEAKLNTFRLKGIEKKGLYPVIIHHWALDKAYVWLEKDESLVSEGPVPLVLINREGKTDQFDFGGVSKEEHLKMANSIFEIIIDSGRVFVNEAELFPFGSPERKNYRIVLNDYYRLVELK